MGGNAWVIAQYENELATTPLTVWDGDEFLDIVADPALLNNAEVLSDGNITTEEARATEGDFQQRFTDKDVRIVRVNVAVTFLP